MASPSRRRTARVPLFPVSSDGNENGNESQEKPAKVRSRKGTIGRAEPQRQQQHGTAAEEPSLGNTDTPLAPPTQSQSHSHSRTTHVTQGSLKRDDSSVDDDDDGDTAEAVEDQCIDKEARSHSSSGTTTNAAAGDTDYDDVLDPDEEQSEEDEDWGLEEADVEALAFGPSPESSAKLDKYTRFVMKPHANAAARAVVKQFSQEMVQTVRESNFLEDPKGSFFHDLESLSFTHTPVVYTKHNAEQASVPDPPSLQKIGQTGDARCRSDYYAEQGVTEERLRPIILLNRMDAATDQKMQDVYDRFMRRMQTDPTLPAAQRAFFAMLREDFGECLGPKKQIFLQLLEIALQLENGIESAMEAFMFDEQVYNEAWEVAFEEASKILRVMKPLLDALDDDNVEIYLAAVSSWATGFLRNLSSTIEALMCLVGDNWKNALPDPVHPNARNGTEGFSMKFSSQQKQRSREIILEQIQLLLKHLLGVLFCDTNELIFSLDPNSEFWSIHNLLETHDFLLQHIGMDGDIHIYVHKKSKLHYIVVHGPMGFASDSREFIQHEGRVKRGLTNTTLYHVIQRLRRMPVLEKDARSDNPFLAMYAFQIPKIGMHQFGQVCAVFYRQFVSPATTNAIAASKLRHLPFSKTVPVALGVRRPNLQKRATDRTHDTSIMIRARSIVTNARSFSNKDVQLVYKQLQTNFSDGGINANLVSYRWKSFFANQVRTGSKLERQLTSVRDHSMQNTGNRTKNRPTVNTTGIEEDFETILKKHAPENEGDDGSFFWIYTGHPNDPDKMEQGSVSECGNFAFPGRYPHYMHLTHETFRGKLKKTNLSLVFLPAKGCNGSVIVTNGSRRGSKNSLVGWKLAFLYKAREGETVKKRKGSEYPVPVELR